MTVAVTDPLVQLWELVDGEPGRWLGMVFRIDSKAPVLKLNYLYESKLSFHDQSYLTASAVKFWQT